MLLQQIAVYATLGLCLDLMGSDWTSTLYWCVLVLVVVSNYLAHKEGFERGLDASTTTLDMANRILDEAKIYIDNHQTKIANEKQELMDKIAQLQNTNKDTQ